MVLAKNAGSFMAGAQDKQVIFEELDVERELMAKMVKYIKLQYFSRVARGSAG